jgi:hypothetical protein
MGLIPQNSVGLPAALIASLNQLVIEKIDWSGAFDIVVRDGKSGFVFFNIEGNLYCYDAGAQLLSIRGGRLLISKEFANAAGTPIRHGFGGWENLGCGSDATHRDRPAFEWRAAIAGDAGTWNATGARCDRWKPLWIGAI